MKYDGYFTMALEIERQWQLASKNKERARLKLSSLNRDTYYNHIQSSLLLSYTHTLPFPSLSEAPCWPQQPPASALRWREGGRFL